MVSFKNCTDSVGDVRVTCDFRCQDSVRQSSCRCWRNDSPQGTLNGNATHGFDEITSFDTGGNKTLVQKCLLKESMEGQTAFLKCRREVDMTTLSSGSLCEKYTVDGKRVRPDHTDNPALSAFISSKNLAQPEVMVKPPVDATRPTPSRIEPDVFSNLPEAIPTFNATVPSLYNFSSENQSKVAESDLGVYLGTFFALLLIFSGVGALLFWRKKMKSNKRGYNHLISES